MDGVASAFSTIDFSIKVTLLLAKYHNEVKSARDEVDRVSREVANLKTVTSRAQQLLDGPNGARLQTSRELVTAIEDGLSRLKSLEQDLHPNDSRKAMRRFGLRALKWPFKSGDVDKIVQNLLRCSQSISQALQVDQTDILLSIDHKTLLDQLPVAAGASFDSYAEEHNSTCLPNTRVKLLEDIQSWVQDATAKKLFWLNGMAGTGKSTIARTLGTLLSERNCLGASFFFKRGEIDRGGLSKFLTTITRQLLVRKPDVATFIKDAVETHPDISSASTREQFKKLIIEPLSKLPLVADHAPLVIVIDALDECEKDDDIRLIINLFTSAQIQQFSTLKVFITSRPELPIRLGFSQVEGTIQGFILQEIPPPTIEHDIDLFLNHELDRIRREYNNSVSRERHLPESWPSQSDTRALVQMTVPLFIFATTACRFISDRKRGSPDIKLKEVLLYQTRSQESKMDATYLPVLDKLVEGLTSRERDEALKSFRAIVGSIVLLANPLSTNALSQLLDISVHTIDSQLDLLHSVLNIPSRRKSPVRLLHLSFRDFLLDPEKSDKNQFFINQQEVHSQLAGHCLRVLRQLKRDICSIKFPGLSRSDISTQVIEACIPPELQYACLYWPYHVEQSKIRLDDGGQVHQFLKRYFLYWLEALSLIGRVSESLAIVKTLQSLLKPQTSIQFTDFLMDAVRFISANMAVINYTPLQLYSSLLVFAPERSQIRIAFESEIPDWIALKPKVRSSWSPSLQTLEGHKGGVESVGFSHDSTYIVSGSTDQTIRIWRTETGECLQTLVAHEQVVTSVAYSHDSSLIVSGSDDETVRIWCAKTGQCLHTLKGHYDTVESVIFSHDSALIGSACLDKTIRVWDVKTGECIKTFVGNTGLVIPSSETLWFCSVAFSRDSIHIAAGDGKNTIWIWNVKTGEVTQKLDHSYDSVNSIAFSPDSSQIAAATDHNKVPIWNLETAELFLELEGHKKFVTSVSYSHDSSLIVSSSWDDTVRVWCTKTGECIHNFEGHTSGVNSVVFTSDSRRIASAASDGTIRIWQVGEGDEEVNKREDYGGRILNLILSNDSTLIASRSNDRMIRIWRAKTCEYIRTLTSSYGFESYIYRFSNDSSLLVSICHDSTMRIWRLESGECVRAFPYKLQEIRDGPLPFVVFSPDATHIASVDYDSKVRIWRLNANERIQIEKCHGGRVYSVTFSYDTKLVASSSSQGLWIWRTETGEHIRELDRGHLYRVSIFSPNSALLATTCDYVIKIWCVETGALRQMLKSPSSEVASMIFSNDSKILASATSDRIVRVWDTVTGVCMQAIDMQVVSILRFFDSGDEALVTEADTIKIKSAIEVPASQGSRSSPIIVNRPRISVSNDRAWITYDNKNLLWLPAERRLDSRWFVPRQAVTEFTVALGGDSGGLIPIEFSSDKLAAVFSTA